MYRNGQLSDTFVQEADELLSIICSQSDNVVIAGDMNIHFELVHDSKVNSCLSVFQSYGFKQQIYEATHIGGGILDQVFTFSLDTNILISSHIDPIDRFTSDHFPIYCNLSVTLSSKYYKNLHYRKLTDIDKPELKSNIKNIIGKMNTSGGFEATYACLRHDFKVIMDNHAPLVTKVVSIVPNAPWFDKEYRKLHSRRRSKYNIIIQDTQFIT